MKDLHLHLGNIHVVFAKKELVWTLCIIAFADTGWYTRFYVQQTLAAERNDTHKIKLANVEYKIVYQFCYLGDMLSASCGVKASSIIHIRIGWKKFKELLPHLTSKVFSYKLKRKIYEACVRSAVIWQWNLTCKERRHLQTLTNWKAHVLTDVQH